MTESFFEEDQPEKQPAVEQSVAERATAEQPSVELPSAEQPSVEQPETEQTEATDAFPVQTFADETEAIAAGEELDAFLEKERQQESAARERRRKKSEAEREADDQWKAWALVAFLIVAAVIILNSSVFCMKSYEINGNERVSDQEILSDLGLSEGTNLFRYALKHINSSPTVDSRLSTVDVHFEWPSHVRIEVEESQTIGYVYFQGTYLCIDRKGQVASTTDVPYSDIPLIVGLTVKSFSIGNSLNTDDAERYDAVVSIGTDLKKYGLEGQVTEINVRVLDDIVLLTPTMEVRVGSMTDMERKICVVAGVLEEPGIPEGTLHIESMSAQIYVEPKEYSTDISDGE